MTSAYTRREQITTLVESARFQRFIVGVILLNAVTLGLETSDAVMAQAGGALSAVPGMKRVVSGLLSAIPAMMSIILLLSLVLYVGAVLATELYGATSPEYFVAAATPASAPSRNARTAVGGFSESPVK